MRKIFLFLFVITIFAHKADADYNDHRGHNVDSLETVMARWTAKNLAEAGEMELRHVADDLDELMNGFNQTNGVKSEYYARILLDMSRRFGWFQRQQAAAKNIGQHFWAKEQYDSAAFYYGMAMQAVEKMSQSSEDSGQKYTQENIDDALSQMYGTLGNLYSMMDSISVAMDYYEKAGELFKKHDWNESCSVLYYNMGETMRYDGQLRPAEKYYHESLDYSLLAADSLAIATAYKGLGSLYLEMHKTSKAMRYLNDANLYFADHEDEELQSRMESLDYTSQVLALQKKRMIMILVLLIFTLIFSAGFFIVIRVARRTRRSLQSATREKNEITEVLDDTLGCLEETVVSLSPSAARKDIFLKPREKEVLDLLSKGYTNAQIAEAMCLSPETIKWYKKKLFAMFEASNSAELVKIVNDRGLI